MAVIKKNLEIPRLYIIASTAFFALSSTAQIVDRPNSGTAAQGARPPEPLKKVEPDIQLGDKPTATPATPATAANSAKVLVKQLRITGQSAFTESQLLAVTGFTPDSQLSLADLQQMAAKVQAYYRSQGYFLARAFVPVQAGGTSIVSISVVEARYGKVDVRNSSGISDATLTSGLANLQTGSPITQAELERSILLLSDTPGITLKSTLSPGQQVGTANLDVDVTPTLKVTGSIDVDTNGNRLVGANRVGASVFVNSPAGRGDLLSLRGQSSFAGLTTGRVAYQAPLFGALRQVQLGAAYAVTQYAVGQELSALQAKGTANVASVFASYPFVRSRSFNLTGQASYDMRALQDRVDSVNTVTDKKANVLNVGISGDRRDNMGGGGITNFGLTYSAGNLNIQSAAARATDDLSARSNGGYGKLSYNASRLQALGAISPGTTLYASVNGQLASKNLDSSEKLILGGATAVRAYPLGEAPGDQGYVVTLEARQQLPQLAAIPGNLQLVGFVDGGSISTNKNTFAAGNNTRNLMGAGFGLNWSQSRSFFVKLDWAWKVGNTPATADADRSGRIWLTAVKYF